MYTIKIEEETLRKLVGLVHEYEEDLQAEAEEEVCRENVRQYIKEDRAEDCQRLGVLGKLNLIEG